MIEMLDSQSYFIKMLQGVKNSSPTYSNIFPLVCLKNENDHKIIKMSKARR